MSASATGFGKRAIGALAILAALMLMVIVGGFAGWTLLEAKWMEAEAGRTELEVMKRRAAAAARSEQTTARALTGDPFLEGTSFALAANALQQRVVALVEAGGGTLVTVGIDPPGTGDDEASRRAVVQAVAEMTIDGVQEVLHKLESETPFAFVEALSVDRVAARNPEAEADQSEQRLRVDLRVTGYFRKEARS